MVVGAGRVAARKLRRLIDCGARVELIAPSIDDSVAGLLATAPADAVIQRQRSFRDDDLDGAALVFAASDDAALNARIAALCDVRNILVNVASDAARGSFSVPAVVERGPLRVALSSGAPAVTRLLRTRLEALLPAGWGRLAAVVGGARPRVRTALPSPSARQRFWERLLHSPFTELALTGREAAARDLLDAALANGEAAAAASCGEVYLVGAGPGDPDLLTFRALRLMQQADVVVYDRLVSQPILDLLPAGTERIYAGKRRAEHSIPQEGINALLTRLAQQGRRVLRLKGGDPFIFGRGGEEIETLMAAGVSFQVVPGITAASGCASYAGIPLTHRDHAQVCVFATGHLRDGSVDLDWPRLARPRQTLVFYMGLQGLAEICRQLIAHGLAKDTPAALVQRGTTPEQRVLAGNLDDLPARVAAAPVSAPTLIIVGGVVTLRERLSWFEPSA